jgi:hypothetical protein
LHLVVPEPVLLLDFLVRHCQPLGQHGSQLFDGQLVADGLLEGTGGQRGTLRAEQLLIPLLADEHAVLEERRGGEDALPHFFVARRHAEPLGFDERRLLVDHLLQNLLVDAELFQQLFTDITAVRVAVRLQLNIVRPPEIGGGDFAALDRGHRAPKRGPGRVLLEKIGDVENNERQHDEAEAPLEPPLMPPHLVEHSHRRTFRIPHRIT